MKPGAPLPPPPGIARAPPQPPAKLSGEAARPLPPPPPSSVNVRPGVPAPPPGLQGGLKPKSTTSQSLTSSASSGQEKRLAEQLAKIRSEIRGYETKHRSNQYQIAKLQKVQQDAKLRAIKQAKEESEAKKSERQALELRLKDLEDENGSIHESLSDLEEKTKEINALSAHVRSRNLDRQKDLIEMRSKLGTLRHIRREAIAKMTADFDKKRNSLAVAHKKVRATPWMKELPSVVEMEDKHRELIVNAVKVLKLMSSRDDESDPIDGDYGVSRLPSDPDDGVTARSFETELFLVENKYVEPQTSHPDQYKGIDQIFTMACGSKESSNKVPVIDLVLAINDLASEVDSLWQGLYERATMLFLPYMHFKKRYTTEETLVSGPTISRAEVIETVKNCNDYVVQGLLLADSKKVKEKMRAEAKEYREKLNLERSPDDAQSSTVSPHVLARAVNMSDYNNELFHMLLEQYRESTIASLREDYETERAQSLRLFEEKMRAAKEAAEEKLGHLKLLPQKIHDVEACVKNNKAVLRTMRLHFEQIRVAALLEQKSMNAKLRKLATRMKKTQGRINAIDERDKRLKEEVTERVRAVWEPEIAKEQKNIDDRLDEMRQEISERVTSIEKDVKDRVHDSFKDLLLELETGLENAEKDLEANQKMYREKIAEARRVHQHLEELLDAEADAKANETKVKAESEASKRPKPTQEDIDKLASARARCAELWELNGTPMERRIEFLEAVVNHASEDDADLLKSMQRYSDQIANFS